MSEAGLTRNTVHSPSSTQGFREGLFGERSLIDRYVDGLGKMAVGGDNVTNFERDHLLE